MSSPAHLAAWLAAALILPALAGEPSGPPLSSPALPHETMPLEAFAALLERPLFSNTRRPALFRSDDGQSLDERQLRDTWRLSGIVLRAGRQSALFSRRPGGERLELEVGMRLEDNWVVERIAEDHVLLLHNQRAVQMLLREPAEAPASPASPPPASPAPPSAPGVPVPGNG